MFAPRRERNISTFDKFHDIDAAEIDDQVFMLNIASEPIDIVWSNMGGTMGFFLFRRILMNVIMFVILIFFSTPASMLSAMKELDYFHLFSLDWTAALPYGGFIRSHIPPLIILSINQVLLFVIDLMAVYEKHHANSDYQYSVYFKSTIYLCLNMLVIPAVTLATNENIIQIFFDKGFDIEKFLGDFYFANSGVFFVSILI
jgi:hypothetical protein